ncbi:hypothetical protein [Rhizobium tubonense]|nr:hypothetical protein [Rhizobium tubonense]
MTASYDFHIGVEDHKSYSHLVVPDSVGKTLRSGRVKNDRPSLWLRWAFVEAVSPAIASDAQLRAQYDHLKIRGTNKARVAIARKLLTIAFQILRDQRAYQPRDTSTTEGASTISRLS